MNADAFLMRSGLIASALPETPEARDQLVGEIRRFIAAGGVLTWADWRDMDEFTRGLFAEARQRIGNDLDEMDAVTAAGAGMAETP